MKRTLRTALAVVVLCAAAGGAARGQSFLGKRLQEWMAGLDNSDAAVRRSAAFALGKMGADGYLAESRLAREAKAALLRLGADTGPPR